MTTEKESESGKITTPQISVELPSLVKHFAKDGPRWKFAAACLQTFGTLALALIGVVGLYLAQHFVK